MTVPTMVRNTTAGPTVFAEGSHFVEWAGAGDPMGGDLQPVPSSFLENVQFHRMTTRGIFVVESGEEIIDETLAKHRAEWESRIEQQRTASRDAIDQLPQNDSVIKKCIGPSGKGPSQLCGQDVPIKAAKVAETPPLCPLHAQLVGQFLAQEGERIVDGKPEVIWARIRQTSRTRQD